MMTPSTPEALIQALQWRYAVKKFDPSRKVDPVTWKAIEQALVLSPSSFGLQPWKFIVVTDPALKESLVPHSWNQRQVADCSHLVVFAIRKHLGVDEIDRFIARIVEVRGGSSASIESYRQMMIATLVNGPRSLWVNEWSTRQAYVALGNLLTSCATLGVDTCPVEGFVPEQYDALLGLSAKGLSATVVCPVGFRAADDAYAQHPKVRFEASDVIEYR